MVGMPKISEFTRPFRALKGEGGVENPGIRTPEVVAMISVAIIDNLENVSAMSSRSVSAAKVHPRRTPRTMVVAGSPVENGNWEAISAIEQASVAATPTVRKDIARNGPNRQTIGGASDEARSKDDSDLSPGLKADTESEGVIWRWWSNETPGWTLGAEGRAGAIKCSPR